jgi:hypothetical protein
MMSNKMLTHADVDRQNTVVHACGWSRPRMNRPPVLKMSDEVTSRSTEAGEAWEPAGTKETATPPSPATAVTLST